MDVTLLYHNVQILTLFCLVDYAILINWTSPFVILGVSGVFFYLFWIEFPVSKQCSKTLIANNVDPDQNAASDLGLYCLPMSVLCNARHIIIIGL